HSGGIIEFTGFAAPYRILGQSSKAALVVKRIGQGLYIKSELAAETPPELLLQFIQTLLEPITYQTLIRETP
ncbi:MAG: hypothetical protein NZ602_15435, partial [Thermoguttaceae bacterium]|nr:hypothetical protein [Thermoguttaceae bacterium]MDW8039729.1 hypothetical protein [Thermoguttaceae bacterium]